MAARYKAIARIVKTHGRRGEVVTQPAHGLPPLMEEGMRVVVVPPRLKGSREHVVTSCSGAGADSGQLVGLSGVEGLQDASALVGRTVLAPLSELPEDLAAHDPRALLGRHVVDEAHGDLGAIAEVMRGPANDVWVVRGAYGEVLVPVVGAYVGHVGPDGPIRVSLPGGLVPGQGEGR